jgi:hypothetical protein
MPIQLGVAPVGNMQRIRIGDLPDFNAGDPSFVVEVFEGWYSAAVGVPTLVANGGGAGAIAIAEEPPEAYYTLGGSIDCGSWPHLEEVRSGLLAALIGGERSVQVLDDRAGGVHKQVFVRAYDRPSMEPLNAILSFTFPLVAPDPFKYGLEPLVGDVGVFTGQSWYRTYSTTGTRTYTLSGSRWVRTYERSVPSGPFPMSLALTNPGDATSRRVSVAVTGPLAVGDWWLWNEATGERMWVDVSVQADQELVLDMAARTARLNGSPVDHLVHGEWLSFVPGANVFRLVSGSASAAFASVSALPAYL